MDALGPRWALEGTVSWVRGERRDLDDDLYRIAPLNGRVGLGYEAGFWSATVEAELYAEQDRVSDTNAETPSQGYGLLHVHGTYRLPVPGEGARLRFGVTNLLDAEYRPHLNGINRVRDSDVELLERLPGAGRSVYAEIALEW